MQVWSNFTYWIADVVLITVSIVFYNIIHHQLDTTKILTGIYIVNDLVVPMFNLPAFIRFYFETIISFTRIETFLCYKEADSKQIEYLPKNSEYAVIIENVDFGVENQIKDNKINNSYSQKKEEEDSKLKIFSNIDDENKKIINEKNINSYDEIIILLRNINFKVKKGEHVGIIGEVGSGKTCLLNAILFPQKKRGWSDLAAAPGLPSPSWGWPRTL